VRLKRMVMAVEKVRELAPAQPSGEFHMAVVEQVDRELSDDLNTPRALALFEATLGGSAGASDRLNAISRIDEVLGLNLIALTRADLRIRPKDAQITEAEVDAELRRRKEARAAKDFAMSDAIRDDLAAKGVEVMDGDPLEWEWITGRN